MQEKNAREICNLGDKFRHYSSSVNQGGKNLKGSKDQSSGFKGFRNSGVPQFGLTLNGES